MGGLLLSALAACVSAVPEPTGADVSAALPRYPDLELAQLVAGRKLYIAKCAGCHQLFLPGSRPAEKWPSIVAQMSARSEVDARGSASIERYLVAASRPRP